MEQTPQNSDSDSNTDYANIITIKKAKPQQPTAPKDNNAQQDTTTPQPQQSSTPIQLDEPQQQIVEHDSTSDLENEPETEKRVATMNNNRHTPATKHTKTIGTKPYIVSQHWENWRIRQIDIWLRSNIYQGGEVLLLFLFPGRSVNAIQRKVM